MERKPLGKTGLPIAPISFGGIIVMDETSKDAARFVSHAIDRGVNYFDVAPSYGNAQEMLGPAYAPYRNDTYLACKTGKRDAAGAETELISSLKALQTDHFDVYQLHALAKPEDVQAAFAPGGCMEFLVKAKEKGYIRNLGISAHSEHVALEALKLYDFQTVLFPINWALGLDRAKGDQMAALCHKPGIGLLAIKALAHRMWLEGEERVFPKSWCKTIFGNDKLGTAAMKYTLSKGVNTMVPPGNFEQFCFMLDHIEECLNNPLTEEDVTYLRQELASVREHHIFDEE